MMEIDNLFSDYREEWAVGDFSERFVKPPYYDELVGTQPMFLVGGRGTGKTVALRSLHFRNQPLGKRRSGIYIKAFKNRVQAFSRPFLDDEDRIRAFEHYINLLCCLELTQLCIIYWPETHLDPMQRNSIELVRSHFYFEETINDYHKLQHVFRLEIAKLSTHLNDPKQDHRPNFSPGEAPVIEMAKDIHEMIGNNEPIHICIDEWENFSNEQQRALNRWIKNCENPITYKVGMRDGGIKTTDTGLGVDPLSSPADYLERRIAGDSMRHFCLNVAEHRLKRANKYNHAVPPNLDGFLESLDWHSEATKLGAETIIGRRAEEIADSQPELRDWLLESKPGESYLALYQAERTKSELTDIINQIVQRSDEWNNIKNNYGHLSLFSITRGRKGISRHKYYAGTNAYLELAGGNVRYLLELLDEALHRHNQQTLSSNENENEYLISAEVQTDAAIDVAKRHLDQVEVLSDEGLMILRLVRALGTAFGALVRVPRNRAPEQTSFTIRGDPEHVEQVRQLINEGCSVLAFVRETLTKRTSPVELREHEYQIHPILSPHFCIPYRKKRRIGIDANVLYAAARGLEGATALYNTITGENPDQLSML